MGTGQRPTISDMMALILTRRLFLLVMASKPAALCCGMETKRRVPGLNDGTYYSGYWEMDIHFRKALQPGQMPDPYVVKFWPETWDSKPHYWHFYEREEIEQSTYDKVKS